MSGEQSGDKVREPLSSKLIPRNRPGVHVSNGADIAGSLVVFFLIGFLLDLWLDTTPIFMIALSVFAMVGTGVRMYYAYTEKMKQLEEDRRNAATGESR